MTTASVRAAVEHAVRQGHLLPHQLAAFTALDQRLSAEQRQAFTDDWRAAGSPAAPAPALVTMAQATAVFGRAPSAVQLADLNACLRRFQITTPARIRHFLAQVGHESGGLRQFMELATGDAYEGRADLGNTQPGDGRRFKGAGAIQLTGRDNYQRFADFIGDPRVMDGAAVVAERYPFTSAGFWWADNKINELIDAGATCRKVSARVNGRDPANGLADREAYFARAVVAITGEQVAARITPASPFSARLSPHIRLGEFALDREERRFRHQHQVDTATELAAFLERVRTRFGGRPVVITSGYRPPAVNSAVGGASASEHLFDAPGVGAVDFYVEGAGIREVQHWCVQHWPYSVGLGAPKGFVHLGIRAGRPRVRWDY